MRWFSSVKLAAAFAPLVIMVWFGTVTPKPGVSALLWDLFRITLTFLVLGGFLVGVIGPGPNRRPAPVDPVAAWFEVECEICGVFLVPGDGEKIAPSVRGAALFPSRLAADGAAIAAGWAVRSIHVCPRHNREARG